MSPGLMRSVQVELLLDSSSELLKGCFDWFAGVGGIPVAGDVELRVEVIYVVCGSVPPVVFEADVSGEASHSIIEARLGQWLLKAEF